MADQIPKIFQDSALPAEPKTDLSTDDLIKIQQYITDGLPGVAALEESKLQRIMELYLSGKTYHQISKITSSNRTMVMYLSHKFNWPAMKREYMHELESNIRSRLIDAKIVSQDFLLGLIHFWQSRIGKSVNKYLATGDESAVAEINPKEIDKYLKTIEILHKLSSEGKSVVKDSPTVGLNLGEGVTVKKLNDKEVEITPKQKTISDMLKQFSDYRREEENKQKPDSKSDIRSSDNDDNQ